jgi:hypothetical protein
MKMGKLLLWGLLLFFLLREFAGLTFSGVENIWKRQSVIEKLIDKF